jgi:hypothetical protein
MKSAGIKPQSQSGRQVMKGERRGVSPPVTTKPAG